MQEEGASRVCWVGISAVAVQVVLMWEEGVVRGGVRIGKHHLQVGAPFVCLCMPMHREVQDRFQTYLSTHTCMHL